LNHYHVGCRSVAGDAFIIKDEITKKLGIPVLSLEWENFDPRVYHHEQYKTRLELFKSMIRPIG
jgi:benzoyl-CoA reductase/2-hydroxyglutaryl-CoA dehydratase subunit BcrC/BadD/HgdB